MSILGFWVGYNLIIRVDYDYLIGYWFVIRVEYDNEVGFLL